MNSRAMRKRLTVLLAVAIAFSALSTNCTLAFAAEGTGEESVICEAFDNDILEKPDVQYDDETVLQEEVLTSEDDELMMPESDKDDVIVSEDEVCAENIDDLKENDTEEVVNAVDQGSDAYSEADGSIEAADWEIYRNGFGDKEKYTYNESTGELFVELSKYNDVICVEAVSEKPLLTLNKITVSRNDPLNWRDDDKLPEVKIFTHSSRVEIVDPAVSYAWNSTKATAKYNSIDHSSYADESYGRIVRHCALKKKDGTLIWMKKLEDENDIALSAGDVLIPEKRLVSGKAGSTSDPADILYRLDTCEIFFANDKTGRLIAYEKSDSTVVSVSQNNVIGNTAVSALNIDGIIGANYIIVEYDDGTYGFCTTLPGYQYQKDNVLGSNFDFNKLAGISNDYTSEEFTIECPYLTADNKNRIEFLITNEEASREDLCDPSKYRDFPWRWFTGSDFRNGKYLRDMGQGMNNKTLYVYYRYNGGASAFTKYVDKPLSFTLGVTKYVYLRPFVSKTFFVGDTLSANDIGLEICPERNRLSQNDIDYVFTNVKPADQKFILLEDGDYDDDSGRHIIPYTFGEWDEDLTFYIIPDDSAVIKVKRDHDLYRVQILESEFFEIKTTKSKLVADSDLKFYYGQDKSGLIDNARIKGLTIDGANVGKKDGLTVKVGKSVNEGVIEEELSDEQLRKVARDSKIFAQFTLGDELKSNVIKLNVDVHPVRAFAKINYFSKRYDLKAEAAVITDTSLLEVVDLYGTPYARTVSFTDYFNTEGVKPVFTAVETGNREYGKQDYDIVFSVKQEYESVKDNYDFTGGNHEDFGYYVAPVYNVVVRGKVESAVMSGVERKADVPFAVNSSMAENLESYKTKYSNKILDINPDVKSKVTLPETVKLLNSRNRFIGWSRDGSRVKGTDTISMDTEYIAEVAESLQGFTASENAVSVVLEDAGIYYTGLKHVTNPSEMEKVYYENAGMIDSVGMTAIAKVRNTANSNSGDVRLLVYFGDRLLIENYDYTAAYKNNINACDIRDTSVIAEKDWAKKAPQVCISFKNSYASLPTITKYFSIHRMDIGRTGVASGVDGCGVDSRIYKTTGRELTLDRVFKTDLVNRYTGRTLNSQKDVEFSIISGDTSVMQEGTKGVKISGKGNYTGIKTVSVNFVSPANLFKWVTVNVPLKQCNIAGDEDEKVDMVDFDTDDTLKTWEEEIKDDICKNIMQKDKSVKVKSTDIILYRVKADYSMPGTKKVNYKAYVFSQNAAKAYKGSYQYMVSGADAECMNVTWNINTDYEVPYAKGGVVIPYTITYKIGEDLYSYDFSRIVKAVYKNNKKTVKNARITLKPIKSSYITGTMDNADFYLDFDIRAAKIDEDIRVKNAYIVSSDIVEEDDAKTISNIRKTGSIVLADEKNNILSCGSDYTIEKIIPQNGKYTVEIKAKGRYYTGTRIIKEVRVLQGYLGSCTIKMTGKAKRIAASDISALMDGTLNNKAFAEKYGLELWGKYGDSKKTQKIEQTDSNFNFVVVENTAGGNAYIQAVGIDGGPLGGSQVLAKKQLKKAIE